MSRHVVYTLHLWPPLGHAAHYTGTRQFGFLNVNVDVGRGVRGTQG